MRARPYLLPAALLLTLIAYFAGQWSQRLPTVRPASSVASQFSAERAFALESSILKERVPHPVGSPANHRVRAAIEQFLQDYNIPYEIQRTWGCSKRFNSCAWVENVIGKIAGKRSGPYVALMAHYDSVPMAPGASDDGAGMATVLETARTLAREGPYRNPILVVLTDAEEAGLLGAEAFYGQSPVAKHIGVVLNLEAAGSTGPSMLLRTSGQNAALVSAYHHAAAWPFANSMTDEIFRRMPNDTDMSVVRRVGIPGIDFAYAGEFTHYHTPNDNLENLDKRSLQHHGENMLPLARELAGIDLGTLKSRADNEYLQLFGLWLQWPYWVNYLLLAISAAALGLVAVRERIFQQGARTIVFALGTPLAVFLGSFIAGLLAMALLRLLLGTIVSWPAHIWPYRLILFSAPPLGGLLAGLWLYRRVALAPALVGAWCWWWLIAALLCFSMPGATGNFLLSLLAAGLLLAAASLLRSPDARTWLLAGTLVVATTFTLGLVLQLERTQGYRLIFVTFPLIALYMVALMPLVRTRKPVALVGLLAVLVAGGMTGAAILPLYSNWRPQHVNIQYVENVDTKRAWYYLVSENPLPERMTRVMAFDHTAAPFPWRSQTRGLLAAATVSGWPAPTVQVTADRVRDGKRHLELVLQAQRPVLIMSLVLPAGLMPTALTLDDIPVTPKVFSRGFLKGHVALLIRGMGNKPVNISMELPDTEPFDAWVTDGSTQLPASADALLSARPPLAVPVHSGDDAMLIRNIRIPAYDER